MELGFVHDCSAPIFLGRCKLIGRREGVASSGVIVEEVEMTMLTADREGLVCGAKGLETLSDENQSRERQTSRYELRLRQ